jgi:hypothetical protein
MYTVLTQFLNPGLKDTFQVPEGINNFYYNSSTMDEPIEVNFEADPLSDSVKWKIGNDSRNFTNRKFFLQFSAPVGKVDVRLIQYRQINKTCFPKDDGVDTFYKRFYVNDGKTSQPILGRFKGYMVGSEQDTFTVTIHHYANSATSRGYYFIKNLPKGNNAIPLGRTDYPDGQGDVIRTLGNRFTISSDYGFSQMHNAGLSYSLGYVRNDSLVINYNLTRNMGKGTFIGIRKK